jgi:hypothetical protein
MNNILTVGEIRFFDELIIIKEIDFLNEIIYFKYIETDEIASACICSDCIDNFQIPTPQQLIGLI